MTSRLLTMTRHALANSTHRNTKLSTALRSLSALGFVVLSGLAIDSLFHLHGYHGDPSVETVVFAMVIVFFGGLAAFGLLARAFWSRPYAVGMLPLYSLFALDGPHCTGFAIGGGAMLCIALSTALEPRVNSWRKSLTIASAAAFTSVLGLAGILATTHIAQSGSGNLEDWVVAISGLSLIALMVPLFRGKTWALLALPFVGLAYTLCASDEVFGSGIYIAAGVTLVPTLFYVVPIAKVLFGSHELVRSDSCS